MKRVLPHSFQISKKSPKVGLITYRAFVEAKKMKPGTFWFVLKRQEVDEPMQEEKTLNLRERRGVFAKLSDSINHCASRPADSLIFLIG